MEKINIGTEANDFTGDSLRAAMQKINANIEETIAPILTVKADVAAFADLATTYPNPEFGWAARVTEDGFIYSWNGFAWKNTGQKNGTVVQTTGTSETDVMSQKAITDTIEYNSIKYVTMYAWGTFEYDPITDTFTYPQISIFQSTGNYVSILSSGSIAASGLSKSSIRILKGKMNPWVISDLAVTLYTDYSFSNNEVILAVAWGSDAPAGLAGKVIPCIKDYTSHGLQQLSNDTQAISDYTGKTEGAEIVTGSPESSITGLVAQNYTDYLWILNIEVQGSGVLDVIKFLYNGKPGLVTIYFFSSTFEVLKKFDVAMPDNLSVPKLLELKAGLDFAAGITIDETWKIGFLSSIDTLNYYVDNTGQPWGIGYLKVVEQAPSVGDTISGGEILAWAPQIGFILKDINLNNRLRHIEAGALLPVYIEGIKSEVNEHEARLSVLEDSGLPADSHNVAFYGAVGDGVTDDREAIQTAINNNYGGYIVFNKGTYYIGNSVIITGTIHIKGIYRNTLIKGTGDFNLIKVSGGYFSLEGISFIGSGKLDNLVKPNQTGIHVEQVVGSGYDEPCRVNISNAEFSNLAGTGVVVRSLGEMGFFDGSTIHNVNAYDCNTGFHLDLRGEFTTLSLFNAHGCDVGVRISGGNMVVGDGSIIYCGIGLKIDDGGSNSAHGTISNVGIKHSSPYNVYCESTQIGFILSNLSVFTGNVYLKNVKGFQFIGCHFEVSHFYFEGALKCRFVNNVLQNSLYTLHHNYNGVASDVSFDETLIMS